MEEKKSYYAIIPASIRYDEEITPNAKLLYGEITALCNQEGYCWATNEYFSKLYKVSKVTVSRWIKELKEKGYINVDIIYKNGSKEIDYRYIQICIEGINKNDNTPINKIVKDNNTNINNTTNNTYELKEINKESFFENEDLDKTFKEYLQMRYEKKCKATPTTIKSLIKKLNKFDTDTAIAMLNNSIENGYQGVFEIKKDKPYRQEVKEKVPEWFDKEIKEEKLSKEEEKEMEEMLKEFK